MYRQLIIHLDHTCVEHSRKDFGGKFVALPNVN